MHISAKELKEQYHMTDGQISLIFNQGFLVIRTEESYTFSVPMAGQWLKHLLSGRLELIRILKRRRYHQATVAFLDKRGLRSSGLTIAYHLLDLEGSLRITRYILAIT